MSAYAIERQAETTARANRSGVEWSVGELNTLRTMRAEGHSLTAVAKRLGRSYFSVSTMAQLAGVAKARHTPAQEPVRACEECWLVHAGEC